MAGNGRVILSWSPSTGATSYNVYRWSSGTQPTLIANVTTTGYTNHNLTDDVTYYYEVTAVDSGGEGVDSSEVYATPYFPTTIDAVNRYAWGANIGWLDWRGDTNNGAVIGAIRLLRLHLWRQRRLDQPGQRQPTNGIQYQNLSASDFGVNQDGQGNLRGYAWGANIGWINFEANGAPKVDLATGNFSGYAWSANCGWISLSNALAYVQTAVQSSPPPPAPALLAPLVANGQVRLTWTASAGATSYKGFCSTSPGETYLTTSPTTNCVDSGLVNGTTYYYEVTAVNSGGVESATVERGECNARAAVGSAIASGAFALGDGFSFSFPLLRASTSPCMPRRMWRCRCTSGRRWDADRNKSGFR